MESVPGECLLEFHLRLAGTLEISLPKGAAPITVTGPKLLVLYQPPGSDVIERVAPKFRDTCVSLYCRPEQLARLARRNGVARLAPLDEIAHLAPGCVWYSQSALSPALTYLGKSLLENRHCDGLRLLHAEAKALELICEMLALAPENHWAPSENESRQLDLARQMLATNLGGTPLRMAQIARAIGMSESKLKRTFKARFGTTVFDYGLECRMRHALELLRGKRMTVGQVAFVVGYRHQTSFAAAFQDYFGFLPSQARTGMQ